MEFTGVGKSQFVEIFICPEVAFTHKTAVKEQSGNKCRFFTIRSVSEGSEFLRGIPH